MPQENLEACKALCQRLSAMEKKRSELALYLCEDANQLSLEELFGTIKTFRGLFLKALKVYCNIPSLQCNIEREVFILFFFFRPLRKMFDIAVPE